MKKRILAGLLALAVTAALVPAALAATLPKSVYMEYDEVEPVIEGMAAVEYRDRWGYVDTDGNLVIECQYDDAGNFSEGLAAVENDKDLYGYIDKTGAVVIPFQFDDAKDFHEGLAAVKKDKQWGYITKAGILVIPYQYGDAEAFYQGVAQVKKNGKWERLSMPNISAEASVLMAYAAAQTVDLDGKSVSLPCYALKDDKGNMTNYIKLRDLAALLKDTPAKFQVSWDGKVSLSTHTAYTADGSELKTPFTGDRVYEPAAATTLVDGKAANLAAFTLKDDNGGGYTYYQLRDLGRALGFNVGWKEGRGIYVETDKAYSEKD